MIDWSLADVEEAAARIRKEVPGAIFSRADYGFALSVAKADLSEAFVVFCPFRQERGNTRAFRSDIDRVIERLKS